MNNKLVFYLYYYEDENLFTDDGGHVVYDIYNLITPQDLYMFRNDEKYTCFALKGYRDAICEIIIIPKEYFKYPEVPDIDFGEDYERLQRYEKAKTMGIF